MEYTQVCTSDFHRGHSSNFEEEEVNCDDSEADGANTRCKGIREVEASFTMDSSDDESPAVTAVTGHIVLASSGVLKRAWCLLELLIWMMAKKNSAKIGIAEDSGTKWA